MNKAEAQKTKSSNNNNDSCSPLKKKSDHSISVETVNKKIVFIVLENTVDNVDEQIICDFGAQFPDLPNISMQERKTPYLWRSYPKKSTKVMEKFINNVGYDYSRVTPQKGAQKAISEMCRFEELHVVLVVYSKRLNLTPRLISSQIEWIAAQFGTSWKNTTICSDKTLLKGDYLIDASPEPALGGIQAPSWQHIMFDQPWNRYITNVTRLSTWTDWKKVFPWVDPFTQEDVPFFIHGSEDSVDEDTMYLFPKMPSHMECVKFCSGTKDDRNIIVVQDGIVCQTFKGPPDEINNELMDTYGLHKQTYPLPIKARLHREIVTKLVHAIRYILFRISHHASKDLKGRLKQTLAHPNFSEWCSTLKEIDFTTFTLTADEYKLIAFQYAQTLALCAGREIYSKSSGAREYPELRPFLYREEVTSQRGILNTMSQILLRKIAALKVQQFTKNHAIHMFFVPPENAPENHLYLQANGVVVDLQDSGTEEKESAVGQQHLLCYPLDHYAFALDQWRNIPQPDWPLDFDTNTQTPPSHLQLLPSETLSPFLSGSSLVWASSRGHLDSGPLCKTAK